MGNNDNHGILVVILILYLDFIILLKIFENTIVALNNKHKSVLHWPINKVIENKFLKIAYTFVFTA